MNTAQVVKELEEKYPGKKIIKNDKDNPTEIICEIEPASDHPEWSKAIAVIDQSIAHYHIKATEHYTIIKGTLTLIVEGEKNYRLPEGQSFIIHQMEHHSAKGDSTWVEVQSTPGWKIEDHRLIEQ